MLFNILLALMLSAACVSALSILLAVFAGGKTEKVHTLDLPVLEVWDDSIPVLGKLVK